MSIPCLWPEPGLAAVNPARACRTLARRDPPLGRLMDRVGRFALTPRTDGGAFDALVRSVVYQQLTGKAAATILGRFRALYPAGPFPAPAAVLQTPHAALRTVGLSEAKARSIRDLAEHAARGDIPAVDELRRMPVEEVIERLTVVRGVGRWTVEMLLIFRLGHPDVLPAYDLGIRKGLARVSRRTALPEPDAVLRRGERWRPWRSIASWYLWRAAELPRPRSRRDSR